MELELELALEVELVVGSTVLVLLEDELLGVMAADVSTRTWGAMVEVGVGVLVLELVLVGQAAGMGASSHSSLWSARPAQASSRLMASGEPDLLGSITTKSYTVGPGTATVLVSVSTARWWK